MTGRIRYFSKIYILCLAGTGLMLSGGCSLKGKSYTPDFTPVKSPDQLYQEAEHLLASKNYSQAAKNFEEIDKQHAFTATARRALLRAAEAYYAHSEYSKAADSAQRYIMLNPGEGDIAYAYYIFGVSNYAEIKDHERDLDPATRALNALSHIVKNYPQSAYAQDSAAKVAIIQELLAGKEMDVGRYYLKNHNYTGAINRFRTVLSLYSTTQHMPEALMRLTEIYLRLGVIPEAQTATAILLKKYPHSSWTRNALNLLKKNDIPPVEDPTSSVEKLLKEGSPKPKA
jgi:outer membrane protein assembly factor BamD